MRKATEVKDPEIKKIFEKFKYERHRSVPKELVKVKSTDTLKPSSGYGVF